MRNTVSPCLFGTVMRTGKTASYFLLERSPAYQYCTSIPFNFPLYFELGYTFIPDTVLQHLWKPNKTFLFIIYQSK
jgi:hypothetical protein